MATWEIVLTSPEDDKWHLVSNQVSFGLHHSCSIEETNHMVQMDMLCQYCQDEVPETLWGMLALGRWGAE